MTAISHKIKKSFNKTGPSSHHKFGTFGGVFTPDVLTILGVIMFLRLGWVVGNAGLLGAILIIVLAKIITICTGLSMSSITTNIKIGAGGPYSIIAKSLGLEAGGSIGIPFYFSQSLSAALYIIGFTEGWLMIFPEHNSVLVSLITAAVLFIISYSGAKHAIRVQYIIFAIIILSVLSFFLTPSAPIDNVTLIGEFEDADFWHVFAIFFPAVTGIMAGANLSGDLKNPRKSIPKGTLSAIGFTLLIYILMAVFSATYISTDELRTNQMYMVDYAIWGPLVIMGILAATFSSALGSLIGAPRILQALANQQTIPLSNIFEKLSPNHEPRNAIIFTGGIIVVSLILGDLDALATLITLFFLITYGTLNLVVFIQQSMKIISFRPTFKISRIIPFIGAIGSFLMMMLISPIFSLLAISTIVSLYIWLSKKGLKADWGDIRGGMFLVLAEVASRIAARFPRHQVAWKPDLLIPIENPQSSVGSLLFIRSITYPSGSIYTFTVTIENVVETKKDLTQAILPLKSENILVSATVLEDKDFLHGAKLVIQTLQGGALRPNTLFLTLGSDEKKDGIINELVNYAKINELGTLILRQHKRTAFGLQRDINLWLRDKSPNWHLAILISLQLQINWGGKINLVTVANDKKDEQRLYKFLNAISEQTRLPSLTEFKVLTGNFTDVIKEAPRADINIFGLGEVLNFNYMREITELSMSSCLFVRDSGKESALV
ncbi:MAG: Na-K-Cl cotransporter [Ignavibacteriales bacterium]|nr:Na-K-Cl cotransporter [Ignavibacteriales bacterium]MCB9258952.1 Na-K-Cl cotransporter [Ignavibacteriales bacterium]